MSLAAPMGDVMRQRQHGVIVLALPYWMADGLLVDALADSVKNVSRIPIAVVPGTMFRPAMDKPGIYRSLKHYGEECHRVILVGYPMPNVFEPTPDMARGFAYGVDFIIHVYPQLSEDVLLKAIKVHPCTKGMPTKAIAVGSEIIHEKAGINWEAREEGATVMTRLI